MKSKINGLLNLLPDLLSRISNEVFLYSIAYALIFLFAFLKLGSRFTVTHALLLLMGYMGGMVSFVMISFRTRPRQKEPSRVEATELFERAKYSCRWLGILGTPRFRTDIGSPSPEERRLVNQITEKAFRKKYQFLFVNPFSHSFEKKMKEELKKEDDVARVRRHMLDNASILAKSSVEARERENDVCVGFHCEPLIWNMIIPDDTVYKGCYVPGQTGHEQMRQRYGPADEPHVSSLCRYYSGLWDAAYKLKWGQDKRITQHALVSAARKKDTHKCDPYTGLRKTNILHRQPGSPHVITKFFTLQDACYAEGIWFSVLANSCPTPALRLQNVDTESRTITREYRPGPCLYDVFMMLNQIINQETQDGGQTAKKAAALRDCLIEKMHQWLSWFQSSDVQTRLDDRLISGTKCTYPFVEKARESLEMIKECVPIYDIYWSKVEDVMDRICKQLAQSADVFLRDANPKNVFLHDGEMTDADATKGIIKNKLETMEDIHALTESMWQLCYHVDFESIYTKSTRFDDYVHLYGSPSLGDADDSRIFSIFSGESADIAGFTVLFRSLRALGRRTYYRYFEPALYEVRYKGERFEHFAILAKRAVCSLMSSTPHPIEGLEQLERLFCATIENVGEK